MRRNSLTLTFSLLLTLAGSAFGAASLLTPNVEIGSSNPRNFAVLNGITYFSATDDVHGNSLWRSDGTADGTFLVKDLGNGNTSQIINLIAVGTNLFAVNSLDRGHAELWKSDGTAAGTVRITNFDYDTSRTIPMIDLNGLLLFAATDSTNGTELWASDGTVAGTGMVTDLNAGLPSSSPRNFSVIGGFAYFSATSATNKSQLWRTDGTAANTTLINTFFNSSAVGPVCEANGILYFSAPNGSTSNGLWTTDGSTATLILDAIDPKELTAVGNLLLFSGKTAAGVELMTSNGIPGDPVVFKDIFAGAQSSNPQNLINISANATNTLYFTATDANGLGIWKSDGTDVGTVLVKNVGSPKNLNAVGSKLFFTATDATNGNELWSSDGTTANTALTKDIRPGVKNSIEFGLNCSPSANGVLIFAADDGTHGNELWKSDGTPAGTLLIKDIATAKSFDVSNLTKVGASVFFTHTGANNIGQLWKTDGTSNGTVFVSNTTSIDGPTNFTPVNNTLYFLDGFNSELWTSDGTGAGTVKIQTLGSGGPTSNIVDVNSVAFITVGTSLWKSDGTTLGTVKITTSVVPDNTAQIAFGGKLIFAGFDVASGKELWKSDGTSAGTVRIKDIAAGNASSSPANFTICNGGLFFLCPSLGELWTTDGTQAGTTRVATGLVAPDSLTSVGSTLFFRCNADASGGELWRSDGTGLGTFMVQSGITALSNLSSPALADFNGKLAFSGSNGANETEVWLSDGSALGTLLLKNTSPGASYSGTFSHELIAVNNNIVFRAFSGQTGIETWTSDGTPAGTHLLYDIAAGGNSSFAAEFIHLGSQVVFSADGLRAGSGLWTFPDTDLTTSAAPEPVLTTVTQQTVAIRDPNLSLQLDGSNFQSNSVVLWNGVAQQTTVLSATQLTAKIALADNMIVGNGIADVSVITPGPGGGTSSILPVTLTKADQTITFTTIGTKVNDNPPFTLSATSSSGLLVTFSKVSGPVTLNTNSVTIDGPGTAVLKASCAGDINYNAAPDVSQSFDILTRPTITWANPARIVEGTPLSATELNATASVAGTLVYTPALGAVLSPGLGQTLSVTFTPTDTTLYATATATVAIDVVQIPVITWSNPADIALGVALGNDQLNASAPTRGQFDYTPAAGTILDVGTHTLSVQFTPSDTANFEVPPVKTVQIAVFGPPKPNGDPAVNASAIFIGQPVTFSWSVGPDDSVVWNFGDGTSAGGSSVEHTFNPAGNYSITVTATNHVGLSVKHAFSVTVLPIGAGGPPQGIDSDGDGFSDVLEKAWGSSAAQSSDTPFGTAPLGTPKALQIQKMSLKFNYARANSDSISISGMLPIPERFSPFYQKVAVDVDGIVRTFLLSATGSAVNGADKFKMKFKSRSGFVFPQNASFQATFSKGNFADALSSSGFGRDQNVTAAPRSLKILVLFNQSAYSADRSLIFTAKAGKTGSAK